MSTTGETVPSQQSHWNFSPSQWNGIIVAGLVASSLSFAANFGVMVIHITLTCIRPYIVNRLSLRMILLSSAFNLIFCVCQLVTDHLPADSKSCRSFAYVLIATDTMACMCLAMVSLNLLMLFAVKTQRFLLSEVSYYLFIIASGVLVTVIPLKFGTPKGPRNPNHSSTCWYHYYFYGRMHNIFNWMYYYSWILFAVFLAALFAAISIRYVGKRQANFTRAMNVFSTNKKDSSSIYLIKKYTADTDVFGKIARRCTLYSLIPLISKSWGIGIEIAAVAKAPVPYAIFFIDRLFACLLGFLVGCLYFSDPAIIACFRYYIDYIKTRYVYDYFTLRYQPLDNLPARKSSQFPQTVEIISTKTPNAQSALSEVTSHRRNTIINIDKTASHSTIDNDAQEVCDHVPSAGNTETTEVPVMQVVAGGCLDFPNNRYYNILKVTAMDGTKYTPINQFSNGDNTKRNLFSIFSTGSSFTTFPMRRINGKELLNSIDFSRKNSYIPQRPIDNENIEKLAQYEHPIIANIMHWILTRIFRVKRVDSQECSTPSRRRRLTQLFQKEVFEVNHVEEDRRLTDHNSFHHNSTTETTPITFTAVTPDIESNHHGHHNYDEYPSTSTALFSNQEQSNKVQLPHNSMEPNRKSSISIGSLGRERAKLEFHSRADSSTSSSLKRIFDRGRAMSMSWSKFSMSKTKESPLFEEKNDEEVTTEPENNAIPLEEISPEQRRNSVFVTDAEIHMYSTELTPRPSKNTKSTKLVLQKTEPVKVDEESRKEKHMEGDQSKNNDQRNSEDQDSKKVEMYNEKNPKHIKNQVMQAQLVETKNDRSDKHLCSLEGQSKTPKEPRKKKRSLKKELLTTSETVCSGASPRFMHRPNESGILHHKPLQLEEDPSNIQYPQTLTEDVNESLKYGRTVVVNISNWQDDSADERDRIETVSDTWDIQEHARQQLGL